MDVNALAIAKLILTFVLSGVGGYLLGWVLCDIYYRLTGGDDDDSR